MSSTGLSLGSFIENTTVTNSHLHSPFTFLIYSPKYATFIFIVIVIIIMKTGMGTFLWWRALLCMVVTLERVGESGREKEQMCGGGEGG